MKYVFWTDFSDKIINEYMNKENIDSIHRRWR